MSKTQSTPTPELAGTADVISSLNCTLADNIRVLDHFLSVLGMTPNDCVIGGSMSLYQNEFPVKDIHDVDIEMTRTDELEDKLKLLAEANPVAYTNSNIQYLTQQEGDCIRYDIQYKGIQFNIWLVPNIETRGYMYMDYHKYATAISVLRHKFGYARIKDLEYFHFLISMLTGMLIQNP